MATNPPSTAQDTLAQLADLLGCSADDFAKGASNPPALSDLCDLLPLWWEIDDASRKRLLEMARQFAASR